MLLISLNTISYLSYDNCDFAVLYKKAGYKLIGTFQEQIVVELRKNWKLCFFAKCKGKNLKKSVYSLPSIISSFIIYGNCIVLQKIDNIIVNIDELQWTAIIAYLNDSNNHTLINVHKCPVIVPPVVVKSTKEINTRKINTSTMEKKTESHATNTFDTSMNIDDCAIQKDNNNNNNKAYLDCQIELTEDYYIEYDSNHN